MNILETQIFQRGWWVYKSSTSCTQAPVAILCKFLVSWLRKIYCPVQTAPTAMQLLPALCPSHSCSLASLVLYETAFCEGGKKSSLGEQQRGREEEVHLSYGVSGDVTGYLQSLVKTVSEVECNLRNIWLLLQMSMGKFLHPLIRSHFTAC